MGRFCLATTFMVLFFFCHSVFSAEQKTGSTIFDCEIEKKRDSFGYEAIKLLHKSMDDDLSGSVDLTESIEFVREELRITEKDRMDKRQKVFHHNNDEFITVDDLWCRWVNAEERRWTTDQMIDWLELGVELPQYKSSFLMHNIRGLDLPRIAVQNTSYLTSVLGIINPVHRQKMQLKAMDVVLFGYRQAKTSYWKDVILVGLLCLAVGGYWFAVSQRTSAQREMSRLSNQMDKLKDIELEFQDLQEKFQEEKRKKESTEKKAGMQEIEKAEQIENLKNQLMYAERLWEKRSPVLQALLRRTYELEMNRINQQKMSSLREMAEARDMVEKFRKKQSSLLNQIRTVHSADMEVIDERILALKQKLEETARSMEECQHRWSQIESFSGFALTTSTAAIHPSVSFPGGASKGNLNGTTTTTAAAAAAAAATAPTAVTDLPPLNFSVLPSAYHAGFGQIASPSSDYDELGSESDFSSHTGSERHHKDVVHSHSTAPLVSLKGQSGDGSGGLDRPSSLYEGVAAHNTTRPPKFVDPIKPPVIFEVYNSSLNSAQRSVSANDLSGANSQLAGGSSSPSISDLRRRHKPPLNRNDTSESFVGSTGSSPASTSLDSPPSNGHPATVTAGKTRLKLGFFKRDKKAVNSAPQPQATT